DDVDDDEAQQEIDETMQETKAALEKIVNVRLSAAQPKNMPKHNSDTKYINLNIPSLKQ
ncbi:SNW domain-containing protein 1-like, partial [Trifolium pratense]